MKRSSFNQEKIIGILKEQEMAMVQKSSQLLKWHLVITTAGLVANDRMFRRCI